MATTLTVPSDYGYVIVTAACCSFLAQWHAIRTGGFRREAKVPYPNPYAPESEARDDKAKYLFNCAQRAHANFIEHQPSFLATLLLSGLRFPIASSAMGFAWIVARVVYAVGYTDRNQIQGRGRRLGVYSSYLPELGLMFTAAFTGWKMVVG